MTVEAVVWDMGGVLLRTEDQTPRQMWAERLGISTHELYEVVFNGEPSRQATVGQGSVEAIWDGLARRFELSAHERAQIERDFWSGDVVDNKLIGYIRSLRPACKTALLSNAWPDVRGFIEKEWGFADAFDHLIISAEVGLAKPDPRIYQLTMDTLNLPAEAAVFIDDREDNVLGARQVGMYALKFESPQQIMGALNNLLGLPDRS